VDSRQKLLEFLGEDGVFHPIEEIASSLGLDEHGTRALLGELSSSGMRISEIPGRGFGLGPVTDILFEREIRRYLRTREFGHQIVFRHDVSSTNSLAMALAGDGEPHGTAVVADRQTGGRGRMGRSWASPAGVNLYLSLILRPELPPAAVSEVPIVIAVAVARTLERQTPPVVSGIKWPNDMVHDRRKLGGILCEMRASASQVHFLVAGIGINVNMVDMESDLSETASSMRLVSGGTYLRPLLAADLLEELEVAWDAWMHAGNLDPFIDPWMKRSVLEGLKVSVATQSGSIEGIAEGLAPSGALKLRMADGSVREVYSGDAHIGPIR
jgi:BirA family transcriptional regulator, biotin operon repressor / biotin---[acetyl-CoA-carboxylase] ligase